MLSLSFLLCIFALKKIIITLNSMNKISIQYYKSPVGDLILGSFKDKLCLCDWTKEERRQKIDKRIQKNLTAKYQEENSPITDKASEELNEYFSGTRKTFDIPLLFCGTVFQQSVWKELLTIPYGTSISYASLAKLTGNPKAIRAVANANKANPISIFVPCHRVIGSNNKLVGYGGGLDAKQFLLELENSVY